MTTARSRFGGLGAVFFLAALGGIALYVQEQTIPEARDELRKPATVLPEVAEEEPPPPLPWQDRLDLAALQLVALDAPPAGGDPAEQPADVDVDEVDPARSRYVQDLSDGHRLLYTLDPVLQQSALTIFRNREVPYAAAVVLDLKDNSVLAMAGHSTMDPGVDPLEILLTAWAPAASTFKLTTAASLLAHGRASSSTKACFHGGLHGIPDELLKDDPARDDRCETLSAAIAHSYNVVIAKLALKHLSQDQLFETTHALQFEQDIPFEFPIERSPALLPSENVARAKVAAGFWNVDLSPMHGAVIASIFARRGMFQPPHVIQQVVGPDGSDLTPVLARSNRVLAKDVAQDVGSMMVGTTTDGTARQSFRDGQGADYIPGMKIAGKTGSLTGKRPPALNYNWFIGFAPADDPEIAFAVVLANEPKWRIKAHYAARRLVQIYLERRDAIAQHRSAKLTPSSLSLPERDPETGVLIARKPADEEAKAPTPPPEEALPPVPGPTAKPALPDLDG